MKFYLAPLEGVTGYIFRNALDAYFPGTDRYFTPFIVPDQKHALRKKELREQSGKGARSADSDERSGALRGDGKGAGGVWV